MLTSFVEMANPNKFRPTFKINGVSIRCPRYLNKDYFTDVISFAHHKPKFIEKSHPTNLVSGDIFISIDRVHENKETYNTIFIKELKRVMVHGALHLIGFKDSTKKDRDIMLEKENIYIELK